MSLPNGDPFYLPDLPVRLVFADGSSCYMVNGRPLFGSPPPDRTLNPYKRGFGAAIIRAHQQATG